MIMPWPDANSTVVSTSVVCSSGKPVVALISPSDTSGNTVISTLPSALMIGVTLSTTPTSRN